MLGEFCIAGIFIAGKFYPWLKFLSQASLCIVLQPTLRHTAS